MKTAPLTVYKDAYKGLIPTGCLKVVNADDIQVLGVDNIMLDDVYDQPDQCAVIYAAGDPVPALTPGSIPLTKVRIGSHFAWVIESPRHIADLFRDCCLTDNAAPVVSLASSSLTPADGTSITLTATASDNGSVAKVQFFEGDTLLSEDTGTPFTHVVAAITEGPHTYVAKAVDNLGKIKYSNTVIVNAT